MGLHFVISKCTFPCLVLQHIYSYPTNHGDQYTKTLYSQRKSISLISLKTLLKSVRRSLEPMLQEHGRPSYGTSTQVLGVSCPPLQEICSVHRMSNCPWYLLSTLILRLECVIEEITERPVYTHIASNIFASLSVVVRLARVRQS